MGFVRTTIENTMDVWEKCLHTDFLERMQNGTLPEDCFKGYIVDDSLYLREYAKVFAWGMTKAQDMDAIRTYYSLLAFVNEGEGATRVKYLERYGLKDSEIQYLPQRKESLAYTNCMIEAAKNAEGAAECIMAVLPCMLSYYWIFDKIIKAHPEVLNTPYGQLVKDYAGEHYEDCCKGWYSYAESVCEGISPERQKVCAKIFRDCSIHELHFWEMSNSPREDI